MTIVSRKVGRPALLECLASLWKRGILVALVSKNDEGPTRRNWDTLYGPRFPFTRFAATRINWRPKAENIDEIISDLTLLPSSVLFVDDNPVERASVKERFPKDRTLDAPLAQWRRILLWSPETQRAVITAEAAQRTEMIQEKICRDQAGS